MSDSAAMSYGVDLQSPSVEMPWHAGVSDAAPFAILCINPDHCPAGLTRIFTMLFLLDGSYASRVLTERPPAKSVYVIYWPGVLEIPWPEGMTAQDAVAAWRGARSDVDEIARVGPSMWPVPAQASAPLRDSPATIALPDASRGHRCPLCGSAGTMIFDDPSRHEHWGRCFKCIHFWERQP